MARLIPCENLSGIITIFVLLLLAISAFSAGHVTLYQDSHHNCCSDTGRGTSTNSILSLNCSRSSGSCETLEIGDTECVTVDTAYRDEVSSINTHGGCALIWEHIACTGESRRIQPTAEDSDDDSCEHTDLSNCKLRISQHWDDELRSLSGCDYKEPEPALPPLSSTSGSCHDGTWIKQVRVKPGYKYGLELDCYAPGAAEKNATIYAAEGLKMGRNVLTSCDSEPMRGIGFMDLSDSKGAVLFGYCHYGQHSQYPYGSLCADQRTAVCGITIHSRGKT